MSAYIVDREHVRYLVEAAISNRLFRAGHGAMYWWHNGESHRLYYHDREEAARVGQMLWDENVASVTHRYPDCEGEGLPGPVGETYEYGEHEGFPYLEIDPVQVLMSCHCYEYQSCEHDGWQDSEAKAFIDALEKAAIRALPGYDNAKWGAPDACYKQTA